MTNTLLTLTLTLTASSLAFGQVSNSNTIESQLNELRVEKARTLKSYSLMASNSRARVSWETHLDTLGNIKLSVNRSGAILRALESERDGMSAAQQARFDALRSQTANLARVTNTLINQIKESGYATLKPAFHDAVNEAYRHALGSRQAVRDLIAMGSSSTPMPSGE